MSVFVDGMKANHGRMVMCHMIADTHEELISMASKIGVDTKWIQSAGTYREHFDICKSKRALAITVGAISISRQSLGRMLMSRRTEAPAPPKGL